MSAPTIRFAHRDEGYDEAMGVVLGALAEAIAPAVRLNLTDRTKVEGVMYLATSTNVFVQRDDWSTEVAVVPVSMITSVTYL